MVCSESLRDRGLVDIPYGRLLRDKVIERAFDLVAPNTKHLRSLVFCKFTAFQVVKHLVGLH